jgi:hypothetical protein
VADRLKKVPGEHALCSFDDVCFSNWRPAPREQQAAAASELWITNFRLVHLRPLSMGEGDAVVAAVPLRSVLIVDDSDPLALRVLCKDFRVFHLHFADAPAAQRALEFLRRSCEDGGADPFALSNREMPVEKKDWRFFNPQKELSRQKVSRDLWKVRLSFLSLSISLCGPR